MNGNGCPNCAKNKRMDKLEFIKRAILVHGNKYDYSLVLYKNIKTKINIICKKHGIFSQSPEKHLLGHSCPKCIIVSKGAENIASFLQKKNILFETEKMFDTCFNPLTNYLLKFDFYLPNYKLLIEYDGEQHFNDTRHFFEEPNIIQYRDQLKNKWAEENNIMLIRIPYWEFKNIEKILTSLIEPSE